MSCFLDNLRRADEICSNELGKNRRFPEYENLRYLDQKRDLLEPGRRREK